MTNANIRTCRVAVVGRFALCDVDSRVDTTDYVPATLLALAGRRP